MTTGRRRAIVRSRGARLVKTRVVVSPPSLGGPLSRAAAAAALGLGGGVVLPRRWFEVGVEGRRVCRRATTTTTPRRRRRTTERASCRLRTAPPLGL